jgi:hypothetical protein
MRVDVNHLYVRDVIEFGEVDVSDLHIQNADGERAIHLAVMKVAHIQRNIDVCIVGCVIKHV